MPTEYEALQAQSQAQAALDAGIDTISAAQFVVFRRYSKVALVSDGSVFWVATDDTLKAVGSLHHATDRRQDEDETLAANQFIFNAESEVVQFNLVGPSSMWIGSWPVDDGPPLRVAFAQRGNYYRQANVWHYSGFAIYPALQTQIIDSPANIPAGPIVSNSLPIFLAQKPDGAPVYPSFLVPDNLVPPYVVIHIPPEGTEVLSAAPMVGPWPGDAVPGSPDHRLSVSQLCRDTVEITLYGFSNAAAWKYLADLYEASESGGAPFGFANSPAIVDEKRPQVEIAALAQKKKITILANYDQGAADAVARRLILAASVSSVDVIGGVPTEGEAASFQNAQIVNSEGSVFE